MRSSAEPSRQIVYRLITMNTVEEKIYRRQVFKQCLLKSTTERENQYRYFGDVQLTRATGAVAAADARFPRAV